MRKDLNKLLCERERHGSHRRFRELRHDKRFNDIGGEELENLPAREGIQKRYKTGWVEKELNENLNPLYGLVRKNVNRPWDKIYSELCEVFNMRSVINNHILEHLYQFVEVKAYVDDDGVIMYRGRYRQEASPVVDEDGPEYYVHPVTGILLKNHLYQSWRQRRNAQNKAYKERKLTGDYGPNRKVISETLELRRRDENGPWFLCTLETMPRFEIITRKVKTINGYEEMMPEKREATRFDAWMKQTVDYNGRGYWSFLNKKKESNDFAKPGYFVKSVKTASRKELKEYLNASSRTSE